jgi:hypothetical protein
MSWLLRRLREPSTWRGLVWLATVAGLSLRPDQAEAIVAAGMALAGLLGVFLADEPKNVRIELPPIDFVGQSQGYNDASQNVGETPAAELERSGADVAAQNFGVRRAGAGAERGDPAADGLRRPVPSHPGPDADTQPSGWDRTGWGDK